MLPHRYKWARRVKLRNRLHFALCGALILITGCSDAAVQQTQTTSAKQYQTLFKAAFKEDGASVDVEIAVQQHRDLLRELNFDAPQQSYKVLSFDGSVTTTDGRIRWLPPATGGSLRYRFDVNNQVSQPPARLQRKNFAVMRLEDLFPRARARTLKGASNAVTIELTGPSNWSFESGYGAVNKPRLLPTEGRAYNRPLGWLLAGDLGTRRDTIAGVRVAVSAPKDTGFRRMDTLVFLRWALPALQQLVPELPDRLLILGAPAEMWRGGISAPNSLYLHSSRPLVSENGTSTLLHELVHVAGVHSAAPGADWIVEGLAEYVGILVLQASGGTSPARLHRTLASLQEWATEANGQLRDPSRGADTASAVLIFDRLNQELKTAGVPFERLLSELITTGEFSTQALEQAAADLLGKPSRVLAELAP